MWQRQPMRFSLACLSGALLALCYWATLIDIFRGFWDHDAGFYLMQSAYMAAGLRPFVDFATIYPPLYNLINAIPIALGVDPFQITWLVPFAWILAISCLSLLYFSEAAPEVPLFGRLLVASLYPVFSIEFGGNHVTLEHGVVFFGLLALAVFERRARFALAGAMIALAFLCKQPGAFFLLPIALQARRWEDLVRLGAGFLVPLLLCLAWLGFDLGSIFASAALLQDYVEQSPQLYPLEGVRAFVRLWRIDFLNRAPPAVALIAFAFGCGLLVVWRARLRHKRVSLLALAWIGVGLALLAARVLNNYPHYTLNAFVPLLALLVLSTRHLATRSIVRVGALATLATILVFLSANEGLTDMRGAQYWTRWRVEGQLVEFIKPTAEAIDAHVPEGASVAQLGAEENILLFLSNRLPLNKDWAGYVQNGPISGDFILFVYAGQQSAERARWRIRHAGYEPVGEWQSPLQRVTLYARQ